MTTITTLEELQALYGNPSPASLMKEKPEITPEYARLIEASPFFALATSGPEGLDCSPRGDRGQAAFIEDERTVHIPDRRGNNRVDSLANIVRDPRVALMFLVPGSDLALRINGRASISVAPELLDRYAMDGKQPRCVIVVAVQSVYFQCSRAVIRADLWNPDRMVPADRLPTAGEILTACSAGSYDGKKFDREWPAQARAGLW